MLADARKPGGGHVIAPSLLLTDLTHLQVLKETGCDFFLGGWVGGQGCGAGGANAIR